MILQSISKTKFAAVRDVLPEVSYAGDTSTRSQPTMLRPEQPLMISRAYNIIGHMVSSVFPWSHTCLYGGQSSNLRSPGARTEARVNGINVKAEVARMIGSNLAPDLLHHTDKRLVPALLCLQ